MVSLQKSGDSAVKFVFENSQHYLYGNGEIVVPLNSLILVEDSSDMVTFKKIDGDIFVSANLAEFGMSKSELEAWYKANMVGSSGGGDGVTSGEVQSMIDESISGKADTTAVTADISAAVSGKQDTLIAGDNITISGNVISASGGTTYTAGRGINIDTANTISTTVPISAGTGLNSAKVGYENNQASENSTFVTGFYTKAQRHSEAAFGHYNVSKGGSSTTWNGSSGSTVLTIGNGSSASYRHNALEVMQNGDIYIPNTDDSTLANYYEKPMVRLQEYTKFKLVQITQSAYDDLVSGGTVDNSTIYYIVN